MIKGSLLWNCLKAAVGAIPLNLMMSAVTLVICIVLGTLIAMVRVYKVPVLKPVMDVLMALSKAFPMNLVLLIFYLIWTTQFSSIAAFFHSQKTIKDVSLMYGNGVSVGHRSVRYSDGFHQRGKCGVLLSGGVCGGSHGILGHRNCVRAAEPLCGAEIFKKR